jgi:hypothetical protein
MSLIRNEYKYKYGDFENQTMPISILLSKIVFMVNSSNNN